VTLGAQFIGQLVGDVRDAERHIVTLAMLRATLGGLEDLEHFVLPTD